MKFKRIYPKWKKLRGQTEFHSLSQDRAWEKQLFREVIPLKKKWCCHPIKDLDEVLNLAA